MTDEDIETRQALGARAHAGDDSGTTDTSDTGDTSDTRGHWDDAA